MANIKITDLTAYTDPLNTDVLPIVDVTSDTTKKVSIADLLKNASAGTAAAPGIAFDGDNTGIYSPGADQLAISTNGTGRLFVDATGRVGIGTTTPQSELTVRGSTPRLTLEPTADTQNCRIEFALTDGTVQSRITGGGSQGSEIRFSQGPTERLRITSTGQLSHIGGGSSGSPAVGFNGSAPANSLVIDSSGNVGIGTASPGAKLTVRGGSLDSIAQVQNETGLTGGTASLRFTVSSVETAKTAEILTERTGALASGALRFHTTNVGGTSVEALRIDSSQRVGIGTTAPEYKTEIVGGVDGAETRILQIRSNYVTNNTATTLRFVNSTNAGFGAGTVEITALRTNATNGSTDLVFRNATGTSVTEKARIDSSGRLLVGTSSASVDARVVLQAHSGSSTQDGKLYIQRGATSLGNNTRTGQINFADSASNVGAAIESWTDDAWASGDYPSRLVFSTTADGASSPTERMRIKNDGTINFSNVAVYADNAAAKTGGLVDGDVYRTSTGDLKIVYT